MIAKVIAWVIVCGIMTMFVYCCCKVASDADNRMDEINIRGKDHEEESAESTDGD